MTALAPSFVVLVIGRFLYGIGIGLVRFVTPLYSFASSLLPYDILLHCSFIGFVFGYPYIVFIVS